jgi:hypothetical protein
MRTEIITPGPAGIIDSVCVFDVIDRLSESLEPLTISNNVSIINDVPPDLFVGTDKNLLASVLSNLLNLLINHQDSGSIQISAKLFGNVVLLHIKDDGGRDFSPVAQNILRIQPMVEKLKGFVGITSHRNDRTTIAFSFVNMCN